ncbi:MAG: hypothetical protein CL862_01785 [Cyanobium sp. NAT70]|nr:hypothetical protein [Cyanobium sp. NAT70]
MYAQVTFADFAMVFFGLFDATQGALQAGHVLHATKMSWPHSVHAFLGISFFLVGESGVEAVGFR